MSIQLNIQASSVYDLRKQLEGLLPEKKKTTPDKAVSLLEGEKYVAAIDTPRTGKYALVLLPGELPPSTHETALKWARAVGGDLPDQIEAAMLHKYLRSEFKEEWYWTNTTYRNNKEFAFIQSFNDGPQYNVHKSSEFRARRIRRVSTPEVTQC